MLTVNSACPAGVSKSTSIALTLYCGPVDWQTKNHPTTVATQAREGDVAAFQSIERRPRSLESYSKLTTRWRVP